MQDIKSENNLNFPNSLLNFNKEFSYSYNTNTNSNTKILFLENEENFFSEFSNVENEIEIKNEKNPLLISLIKNKSQKAEKIKCVLITEKKIFLKFQKFISDLENYFNLKIYFYFLEEGDFFKQNFDANKILEFCLEQNLQKKSIIIGLGGGKITDISGYIASNYFRGISSILIPTNLLSMVDASIGGKNGINSLVYGKNVIGTIVQPDLILINLWMLIDLEDNLISEGFAEIIKICLLTDSELLEILKHQNIQSLKKNKKLFYSIVKKNILEKINIIKQDVKDSGFRNVLNFGHTVGHAVESLEAFNISHGKSVSIGLIAEIKLAIMQKKTKENVLFIAKEILENFNLPTEIPENILNNFQDLIEKFKTDKKNDNEKIRFIYLESIGSINAQKEKGFFLSIEKKELMKHFAKRIYIVNNKNNKEDNDKFTERKIINLKGSKSICNRALILSALAKGKIFLENFLFSEDTIIMIKCLRQLGINIEIISEDKVIVYGNGIENFTNKKVNLFVENAGTAARFITTFSLLFRNSVITIDGIPRMRERPIDDLLDSILLTQKISGEKSEGKNFEYFNDLFSSDFNTEIDRDIVNGILKEEFAFFNEENKFIKMRNNFEILYQGENKRMPFTIITSKEGFYLEEENEIRIKSQKSSQFVSALLLISPFVNICKFDKEKDESFLNIVLTDVDINNDNDNKPVSYQYIEMTLKMMEIWGVKVSYDPNKMHKFAIKINNKINKDNNTINNNTNTNNDNDNDNKIIKNSGNFYINKTNYTIEPDASTANFYLAYIALNGGDIKIQSIGKNSIQGDSKFINFLEKILPNILNYSIEENHIILKCEKLKTKNEKNSKEIFFDENISLITDSFLALGIICSQIPGEFYFRGISNQAIKECNRLEIFCENLNKIGIFCQILKNSEGIFINSKKFLRKNNLNSIEIKTANDHRMAMSFAILGKFLKNSKIFIDNKFCVGKTYKEFWEDFEEIFGMEISVEEINLKKSVFDLGKENFLNKPIFLVGMRSCGKSTFGEKAARNLGLDFFDADEILTEKFRKEYGINSIADLVDKKGWEYFRMKEREFFYEIFCESYKYNNSIIAFGGGIVENEEILIALKSIGIVIFIDTDIDNIEAFIKIKEEIKYLKMLKVDKGNKIKEKDNNRPDYANKVSLKEVYEKRLERYLYLGKHVFKTPNIWQRNLEYFLIRMRKLIEKLLGNDTSIDDSDFINEDCIDICIENFNKIVDLFCNIFTNRIYQAGSPMKFPMPNDNSNFVCIQINEEFLQKILYVKYIIFDLTPVENYDKSSNTNIKINLLDLFIKGELANFSDENLQEILLKKIKHLNNLNNKTLNNNNNNESNKLIPEDNHTISKIINFIKINFNKYNAIELRFDYLLQILTEINTTNINNNNNKNNKLISLLKNFSQENFLQKQKNFSKLFAYIIQEIKFLTLNKSPIIFTIRTKSQGGFFNENLSKNLYKEINSEILKFGIEFIDIEFSQKNIFFIEEIFQKAKNYNTNLILSNHFVEKKFCENLNFLKKEIHTMSLLNCDIVKIVIAENEKIFLNLKIFLEENIKKPLIFFQMGNSICAKFSRICNTFMLPVFDENIAEPTAKGQLSLNDIEKVKEIFEGKNNENDNNINNPIANNDSKFYDFYYKVFGAKVNSSPSPRLYENAYCKENISSGFKLDFDIEFTYKNINEKDYNYYDKDKDNNNNNNNQDMILFNEKIEFFKQIFTQNLLFGSITIPFKSYLIDLAKNKLTNKDLLLLNSNDNHKISKDNLIFSSEATEIYAVNTIKKINKNKIFCYNTDFIANYEIISQCLKKLNKEISEIKILILGAGGAANAVIYSIKQINFHLKNLFIYNRTQKNAEILAEKYEVNFYEIFEENEKLDDSKNIEFFDIVISTIPRDTDENFFKFLLNKICRDTILLDLAYAIKEFGENTNFRKVLGGKVRDDNYIDGLVFLRKLVNYSYEIFFGKLSKLRNEKMIDC